MPNTLWVISPSRIRQGLGPFEINRVEPVMITQSGERILAGYYGRPVKNKGRDTYYGVHECFMSEEDAKREGERMARAELAHEQAKFDALKQRIQNARLACAS